MQKLQLKDANSCDVEKSCTHSWYFQKTLNAAYHVTVSDSSEEELNMAVCIAVIAKEVLISTFNHPFVYPQPGLNVKYFPICVLIFEQMPVLYGILVLVKQLQTKLTAANNISIVIGWVLLQLVHIAKSILWQRMFSCFNTIVCLFSFMSFS